MAKAMTIEEFRIDVENKFNIALADMAAETTFAIEYAYESVVQSFYDEYGPNNGDPWYYKRTYSTYEASSRADDPFGYTPIEANVFESGIEVDHENILGNPYRADKHWVFTRTFNEGIHGFFKTEMEGWKKNYFKRRVLSKKKKEKMQKYFNSMIKHAPKKYKGITKESIVSIVAQNPDVTLLKSVAPTAKGSSPRAMMDKAFKQITKKQHMDKMFDNIMKSYGWSE